MPIKKNILSLFILFLLLISCHQKMNLSLNESAGQISGHIQMNLTIEPIFGAYLKNLDLFSGIEAPKEELPASISDPLNTYRQTQKNYQQSSSFDARSGRYSVNAGFDFEDLNTLADPKMRSIVSDILSVSSAAGKTTVRVEFNEDNRKKLEEHLPILPPLPPQRDAQAQRTYLGSLAQAIVEFQEKIPAAQREINTSQITIHVTAPRPIAQIIGGKVTNKEGTQAVFEIPLTEIIFLKKDCLFSLTF